VAPSDGVAEGQFRPVSVARPAMRTGSRALWAGRDRVVVTSAAIS
jgi:hypothetical protein